MRPSRNQIVSVARFDAVKTLEIVDFTKTISTDPLEESAAYYLKFQSLLFYLGWELAWPLERDDNPSDYIPCQSLVERIKETGFDGMKYTSSLDPDGKNIVLFDPAVAKYQESWLVRISDVSIDWKRE